MVGADKIFTTGEVAKLCKVSPRTVSGWFDSGELKGYRLPGSRDRRIPRNDLIDFLRKHRMPLGDLEKVGTSMLVVGTGRMTKLAESIAERAGTEMSIDRCDTFFQATLKMGRAQIRVLLVDVGERGLQETVQSILEV